MITYSHNQIAMQLYVASCHPAKNGTVHHGKMHTADLPDACPQTHLGSTDADRTLLC